MQKMAEKMVGEKLRLSCLVFLAVFVGLQAFSIAHATKFGSSPHHHEITVTEPDEHGDRPHTHEGPICEIFLLGDKTKFADSCSAKGLQFVVLPERQLHRWAALDRETSIHKGAYPRAPPIILPS